jgi:hypothetical protein
MGQVNLVIDEIAQHAIDCATSLEDVEHQPDRRLHLLVGIGGDCAGGRANIAARQIEEQLAALGLGAAAGQHAAFQQVQLRLAHRALQTEKEAVVVKSRVIHAVRVGKEGVEHSANLEKLVPVPARSCQAGHLDTEHQTDPAEPDFGNQTLKARVHCGRGAGAPEIIIDHHHPLTAPAKLEGAFDETVLQPGRLLMPLDLLQGGLPDVDDGQAVTMAALDLVGDAHCAPPRRMDRGHDRGPPERERSPADAARVGRAERRGAGALRPAIVPRS